MDMFYAAVAMRGAYTGSAIPRCMGREPGTDSSVSTELVPSCIVSEKKTIKPCAVGKPGAVGGIGMISETDATSDRS